jgi:hypothetical protein
MWVGLETEKPILIASLSLPFRIMQADKNRLTYTMLRKNIVISTTWWRRRESNPQLGCKHWRSHVPGKKKGNNSRGKREIP